MSYSSRAILLLSHCRRVIQIAALDLEAATTEVGAELQEVEQKQLYTVEFLPPFQSGKVNDNVMSQLNTRSQVLSCPAFLPLRHCQKSSVCSSIFRGRHNSSTSWSSRPHFRAAK
jgi:hypothetical protein